MDIARLPNIVGAIDGTHIRLNCRPTRRFTPMPSYFYNMKRFHCIVLHGICDVDRIFWNVCACQSCGVHDPCKFDVSSRASL